MNSFTTWEYMVMNESKEQVIGDLRRKCRDPDCHVHQVQTYSPWSNLAEGAIREEKYGSRHRMAAKRAPKRLWDDSLELCADILSHTARDTFDLQGRTPQETLSGQPANISRYAEFHFYDWVYWYDKQV